MEPEEHDDGTVAHYYDQRIQPSLFFEQISPTLFKKGTEVYSRSEAAKARLNLTSLEPT